MPSSLLFGINNEGRVHTLSTTGTMWRELPYAGQEFKKLSAIPHFLWALGGDHQIYVYVHGLDVPIKIKEESYENERWLPIEGFSSRLLPTDRYRFSNAEGTEDRSIDKIRLPSMAWQWEGDWQLDLTLDGQPLDHNGWTYAVDFPAQYHAKKQWTSCVRRRLWMRSRKYSAMNSWCAVAPLHKDATSEPFIDISIGGQNVSGADPGTMLVWAVTAHSRVMFRQGVTTQSPEGARWNSVALPLGCEVQQISVGPSGLVWATLANGQAIVRIGVTREKLSGDSWVEVRSPGPELRLIQLSVGFSSVWAVTHTKQVYFRKGIKGEGAGVSEEMAAGCGWVEMVGRMMQVSVASNDQVFAVGADDRLVYFRSGLGTQDLTGKRWRTLHAGMQVSRASSNASLNRDRFRSFGMLQSRPSSMVEPSTLPAQWEEPPHSAPSAPHSLPVGGKYETQPMNPGAWSPVRSVGSVLGTEAHPDMDESVWSESSRDSCIFTEDEELGWADYEAPWSWVEAGACTVDPTQLPNWFSEMGSQSNLAGFEQPWRLKILQGLQKRVPETYSSYELAIDTHSWTHTGEARVSLHRDLPFIDCLLQLEWVHNHGTLTILNADGATAMYQFSLGDITCVQLCSEPGSPRLAIHIPRHSHPLIKLQFTSDNALEEFHSHFYSTCGKIHETLGKPSDQSIWLTTGLGDIFVWDPTQLEINQLRENDFFVQKYDLSGKQLPIRIALHAGCQPGCVITLTACIADDADRLALNLEAQHTFKPKHKTFSELENICLHFNPRFGDDCIIRNSMLDGKWGQEETDGEMPLKRGQEFTLSIETTEDAFLIYLNENLFTTFRHRMSPTYVSVLHLWGRMQPFRLVIKSPEIIIDPLEMYFRQIGGHLKRVSSCGVGVTWGLGYNQTAWVYTGGYGGGFVSSLDSQGVYPMTDSQDYRLYENQRWNPVTGYTSTGLPTDRPMWSDVTGRHRRTREHAKLLSSHWQWLSDWMVDFHPPGGADRDGWQYAVDFPTSYHARKQFADCVRRRRWYRRCSVTTSGPWQELGHTRLMDVALEAVREDVDSTVVVWGVATGGQVVVRTGVSRACPMGVSWEHVSSNHSLCSISCGPFKQVWAVSKKGCAYYRLGITEDKLEGTKWQCIEPPSGGHLRQISVGEAGVWAVDTDGKLHVRKEITSTFPEGTHWVTIMADPSVINSAPDTKGFKRVSVGKRDVWATTDSGVLLRRQGIHQDNVAGCSWDTGIAGNWNDVCAAAFN